MARSDLSQSKIKRRKTGIYQKKKFTRLRRRIIIEGLKARLPIGRCCELAGIEYESFRKWMEKGKNKERPAYARFRRTVQKIQVFNERESLDIIRRAAQGGEKIRETKVTVGGKHGMERTIVRKHKGSCWQAAAWWLERKCGYTKEDAAADQRSSEEMARDVKEALDRMLESVPMPVEEEEYADE